MNKTAAPVTQRNKTDSYYGFYGMGRFKYAIYPDYWKESWGPKPLLGHVWADDEFYAVRDAYTKKLLPMNYTFGPRAVKVYTPKTRTTN
jgi:hypothetical protein